MDSIAVTELIKAVDDQVAIRGYARVFQVPQAASLGVPTLESDPADADWTTELQTGSEDTSMSFGKRQLFPHPLAKRIKISQQLLRQALIGPEALVIDRLSYKFAVTQEKGFLTGSGANSPLGVFTASVSGISIARDVSTGNSTTSMTFDGLIEAKYTLKGQCWPNARWIFHRSGLKQLAKAKDGEGQYIQALGPRRRARYLARAAHDAVGVGPKHVHHRLIRRTARRLTALLDRRRIIHADPASE